MKEWEELFISIAKMEIDRADKFIKEFSEDVVKNAEYTLSWSDKAFREAARKKVLTRFVDAVTNTETPVTFRTFLLSLQEELLSYAKYPENSSSVSSNHMKREMGAAVAQLFGDLQKSVERHG